MTYRTALSDSGLAGRQAQSESKGSGIFNHGNCMLQICISKRPDYSEGIPLVQIRPSREINF